MELVFIHGANSSSSSWNYAKLFFDGYPKTFIEFDSSVSFQKNLEQQEEQLANKKSIFFIAHSMGGVYAYYLQALLSNVKGGVTLAAPYGGSSISSILKLFFPGNVLWVDSCVSSPVIRGLQKLTMHPNWHQVVCTTTHTSYTLEPNDGLITKYSQMRLEGVNYIDVVDNHSEVLQNDHVIKIIQDIINNTK